jgi:hypothetical protein
MARFGLSPYANPIESGVDTFVKLNSVFNSNDRMKLEQQQNDRAQQESDRRGRMDEQKQQEWEADAPIREGEHKKKLQDIETAEYGPHWQSAEQEFHTAATEGRQPAFTPAQTAAVEVAAKRSKVDLEAVNDLAAHLPKWMGAVQQSPQKQIKIDDPKIIEDFNRTYGQQLGGKAAKAVYFDKDRNAFAFGVDDGKGGTEPLTDKEGKYVLQLPADKVIKDVLQHGIASGIVQTARMNTDPDYRKAVEKEALTQKENIIQQHALSKVDTEASTSEQRKQFLQALADLGSSVPVKERAALAKEFVEEKPAKTRNLMKVTSGTSEVLVDPEAEGGPKEVWKGAPQPKKEADPYVSESRRQRADDRKEKDTSKRRDTLVKEKLAILNKDPNWQDKEFAERQNEAETQADAQISGKPAPKQQGAGNVKTLTGWMKGLAPEGTFSGTNMKETVKGAIDQGHTVADLRAAANSLPAKSEDDIKRKNQLLKAINGTDEKPAPAQYKGEILTDKQSGKRYKSDGKSWNELS